MSLVQAIVATTLDGLAQSLRARAEATALAADGDASPAASAGPGRSAVETASGSPRAPGRAAGTAVRLTDAALLAAELSRTPSAARIVASAPLVTAGADASTIAAALRDAIATSGLFYESHVAAWAAGEHAAEMLAREPQAMLAERPDLQHPRDAVRDEAPRPDAAATRNAAQAEPGTERAHLATLARDLVGQQLQLASDPRLTWQGEPWPGQRAEIAVEREPHEACGRGTEPVWRTTVALELPQLGRVQAELRLTGTRVSVALLADDAAACATLLGGSSELAAAMKTSGLTVAAISVNRDAGPA